MGKIFRRFGASPWGWLLLSMMAAALAVTMIWATERATASDRRDGADRNARGDGARRQERTAGANRGEAPPRRESGRASEGRRGEEGRRPGGGRSPGSTPPGRRGALEGRLGARADRPNKLPRDRQRHREAPTRQGLCLADKPWLAQYYNSSRPGGMAVAHECLAEMKRDYRTTPPPASPDKTGPAANRQAMGVNPDRFSVVFTSAVKFREAGEWKIRYKYKGSMKLEIGKKVIFDKKRGSLEVGDQNAILTRGKHPVRIEYYDIAHPGVVEAAFELVRIDCPNGEWKGKYYNSDNVQTNSVYQFCTRSIDYQWGNSKPVPEITRDNWSAVWSRLYPIATGDTLWYKIDSLGVAYFSVAGYLLFNQWSGARGHNPGGYLSTGSNPEVMLYVKYKNTPGSPARLKLETRACPGNVRELSLRLPDANHNSEPFQATLTANVCVGLRGRPAVTINGSPAIVTADGDTGRYTVSGTYRTAELLDIAARAEPLVGSAVTGSWNYRFATCQDGLKNGREGGVDCGGPCPSLCTDCFSETSPGSGAAARFFSLGSSYVASHGQYALNHYLNFINGRDGTSHGLSYFSKELVGRQLASDRIILAVARYVDDNMTYMFDDDDWGQASAEATIRRSGSRRGWLGGTKEKDKTSENRVACPSLFCGDCEDHAYLRFGLLRALGLGRRCVWCADHHNTHDQGQSSCPDRAKKGVSGGHAYNLVYYQGKYRILDYGPEPRLGSSADCWDQHATDNIYDDVYGENWEHKGTRLRPLGSLHHNYPGPRSCGGPSWNWKTYYTDVCP